MLEIEITRLIAAAVAAVLLGYACYVAAYVQHKNSIRDTDNMQRLAAKDNGTDYDPTLIREFRLEKTKTWYFGYRLALLGLIIVSTAVGWAVGWAVGQDYALTWVEDAALAAAGAIIGGMCLDKWIIHPIADGSFFEKVEDPIVQRFLQDAAPVVEEVKEKKPGFFARKKAKKAAKKEQETPSFNAAEAPVEEAPEDPLKTMSFDEKVKLIESLRKSL